MTPKRYDLRLEVRTLGVDDSFDGSLKAELDLLNLGHLRFLCQEVLFFKTYKGVGLNDEANWSCIYFFKHLWKGGIFFLVPGVCGGKMQLRLVLGGKKEGNWSGHSEVSDLLDLCLSKLSLKMHHWYTALSFAEGD